MIPFSLLLFFIFHSFLFPLSSFLFSLFSFLFSLFLLFFFRPQAADLSESFFSHFVQLLTYAAVLRAFYNFLAYYHQYFRPDPSMGVKAKLKPRESRKSPCRHRVIQ